MKLDGSTLHLEILTALRAAIVWAVPPEAGMSIAAFSDNNDFDEAELRTCLSEQERAKALRIGDAKEKRHYVVRRCFQRVFVKSVINWQGEASALAIEHKLDTQPKCLNAPELRLSFSSSGSTALASASPLHIIGVDIEKRRPIENVAALAQRFFSPAESETLLKMRSDEQNEAFLKHWTAKEAGLKAIGRGIVSGLNSFKLKPHGDYYHIDCIDEIRRSSPWKLDYLNFMPHHIVAVVHNIEK